MAGGMVCPCNREAGTDSIGKIALHIALLATSCEGRLEGRDLVTSGHLRNTACDVRAFAHPSGRQVDVLRHSK
jgi:hypothetical protein